MSRKDFELIARTINNLQIPQDTKAEIAQRFADNLSNTNPRFDYSRFVTACLKD